MEYHSVSIGGGYTFATRSGPQPDSEVLQWLNEHAPSATLLSDAGSLEVHFDDQSTATLFSIAFM